MAGRTKDNKNGGAKARTATVLAVIFCVLLLVVAFLPGLPSLIADYRSSDPTDNPPRSITSEVDALGSSIDGVDGLKKNVEDLLKPAAKVMEERARLTALQLQSARKEVDAIAVFDRLSTEPGNPAGVDNLVVSEQALTALTPLRPTPDVSARASSLLKSETADLLLVHDALLDSYGKLTANRLELGAQVDKLKAVSAPVTQGEEPDRVALTENPYSVAAREVLKVMIPLTALLWFFQFGGANDAILKLVNRITSIKITNLFDLTADSSPEDRAEVGRSFENAISAMRKVVKERLATFDTENEFTKKATQSYSRIKEDVFGWADPPAPVAEDVGGVKPPVKPIKTKKAPVSLRCTIQGQDILLRDTLCQLTDYLGVGSMGNRGRSWPIQYGLIGYVWRTNKDRLINDLSAETPGGDSPEMMLITSWGMLEHQAKEAASVGRMSFFCVVLRDSEQRPLGLIYFDAMDADTFKHVDETEAANKIRAICSELGLIDCLANYEQNIRRRSSMIQIHSSLG